MATKNCPKCDSPNPVACKKCACGHVFFTNRRSANALAVADPTLEDLQEPPIPHEVDAPRRRTARETRQRPQFYDALQVENQTRRQRELQKRRKASKSEEVEAPVEEPIEKPTPTNKRSRVESPPTKVVDPPVKKRRGRPPGLTNRKTGRAQILPTNKGNDAGKKAEGENLAGAEVENIGNVHDVSAMKALQMNLVLSDINSRITSSAVRAENDLPPETNEESGDSDSKMEVDESEVTKIDDEEPEVKSSKAEIDNVDLKNINIVEEEEALDTEQKTKEKKELKEKVITDDDNKVPDLKADGDENITKEAHPKIEKDEDSPNLNLENEDKSDSKKEVSDVEADNDNSSIEDAKDSMKSPITEIESEKEEKAVVSVADVAIDSDQGVDNDDSTKSDPKDTSKDTITNGDQPHGEEADVKKQLSPETKLEDEVNQIMCGKAVDTDADTNINGRCALSSE